MLLVSQGRLSLADEVHALTPVPNTIHPRITIGDMLHHTSGIRDQWMLLTLAGWRLSDDVVKQEDVLNLVKRMKALNFAPGTEFSYSNTKIRSAGVEGELACSARPMANNTPRRTMESKRLMELSITLTGDRRLAENVILEVRAMAQRYGLEIPSVRVLPESSIGPRKLRSAPRDKRRANLPKAACRD